VSVIVIVMELVIMTMQRKSIRCEIKQTLNSALRSPFEASKDSACA